MNTQTPPLFLIYLLAILATIPIALTTASKHKPHKHRRHDGTPSCPSTLHSSISLTKTLTFHYAVVPSQNSNDSNSRNSRNLSILCARLERQGLSWLGFGISPNSKMVGSHIIVGRPDDDFSVLKYEVKAKSTYLIHELPWKQQTLMDESIVQEDGRTIMTFTKYLEEEKEHLILAEGENVFIYAEAYDNVWQYHGARKGSFKLDFSKVEKKSQEEDNKTKSNTRGGSQVSEEKDVSESEEASSADIVENVTSTPEDKADIDGNDASAKAEAVTGDISDENEPDTRQASTSSKHEETTKKVEEARQKWKEAQQRASEASQQPQKTQKEKTSSDSESVDILSKKEVEIYHFYTELADLQKKLDDTIFSLRQVHRVERKSLTDQIAFLEEELVRSRKEVGELKLELKMERGGRGKEGDRSGDDGEISGSGTKSENASDGECDKVGDDVCLKD